MEHLLKLKELLDRELKEISRQGELSAGSLETIHKLTDTIKNIDKICMLEEEGGYSQEGGSSREGGYSGRGRRSYNSQDGGSSYEGGSSYGGGYSQARRGKHYVRAHYSYDDGKEEMLKDLEEMAGRFSDQEWQQLEEFMQRIRGK